MHLSCSYPHRTVTTAPFPPSIAWIEVETESGPRDSYTIPMRCLTDAVAVYSPPLRHGVLTAPGLRLWNDTTLIRKSRLTDICGILCGMEDSDKQHVGQAIRELCAVHKVKWGSDVFSGYWSGLKTMSRADFDSALADLRENSEWMPRPAHFRAALRKGWL